MDWNYTGTDPLFTDKVIIHNQSDTVLQGRKMNMQLSRGYSSTIPQQLHQSVK